MGSNQRGMSMKGSTIAMKAVVRGFPPFLGTGDCQELHSQFLRIGGMVKLTGRGKLITEVAGVHTGQHLGKAIVKKPGS